MCEETLARTLTPREEQLLNHQDTRIVPQHKQKQLENDARKHWDLFYKRNSTKFFKDRHWTTREFQELSGTSSTGKECLTILEVGCGVGNFMFPLMKELEHVYFYACDFSPRAVQFVKDNIQYDSTKSTAFCCDITNDSLCDDISPGTVDIATLIFCLSAIHPDKMIAALHNISQVLKPGGCVLFRDYGLYDHAMIRFAAGHKLMERFYVRQDGTRAYYFTPEKLKELFDKSGFDTASVEYVHRETVNHKEGICVPRVFVQGKFVKRTKTCVLQPLNSDDS